jgi:hypothetical protein
MKQYSVFFHRGDDLTLKTRVMKGRAWVDEVGLHIAIPNCAKTAQSGSPGVEAPQAFIIPADEVISAEIFRLHGLGRVIRVEHKGGRLFLAVVRLMIGQFAFINFFKTGTLQKEIAAIAKSG